MKPAPSPVAALLRALLANLFALALCLGLIGSAFLFFAFPWWSQPRPGDALLQRYAPLQDGQSRLIIDYGQDDKPNKWTSENQAILNQIPALANQLPRQTIGAIFGKYQIAGDTSVAIGTALRDVQIIETLQRTLQADGGTHTLSNIALRDQNGEYYLSNYDAETAQERIFNPPLLLLPISLTVGYTWNNTGFLSGSGISLTYALSGSVAGQDRRVTDMGEQDDCVRIDTELALVQPKTGQSIAHSRDESWYCAGIGWVEAHSVDLLQNTLTRQTLAKASGTPNFLPIPLPNSASPPPPPQSPQPAAPTPPQPEQWELSRLGVLPRSGPEHPNTLPLALIDGPQPLLIAGLYSGDLIAYNAATSLHEIVWRFHLSGPAYGPPAVDVERGRIYIGCSDKHLYALDQRGLFLWSFATFDNIATRPVLAHNLIIFGSEDRRIYALDAETGELRWQYETGGAVVSSPALARDLVVIGSDDGQVYALDIATGKPRWVLATQSQVEAGIAVAPDQEDILYAASRDGNLYAINAQTGQRIWQAPGDQLAFREAPAVGAQQLYQIDINGGLYAFERTSGHRLWRSNHERYVGTPTVLQAGEDELILLTQRDGVLELRKADGTTLKTWKATEASLPSDGDPTFTFGATHGQMGNAEVAWVLDHTGVMRLLAPAAAITRVLKPSFLHNGLEQDFLYSTFDTPAAPYRDQALLLDSQDRLHVIDPQSGASKLLGQLDLAKVGGRMGPVSAGEIAVLPRNGVLSAFHLPDAKPMWQVDSGNDHALFDPTIINDTVFWATSRLIDSATQTGTLQAINLLTGEVRWQIDVEGFIAIGNPFGDDKGALYLSSPPIALDAQTGEPKWQAMLDTAQTLGGGAISPDGQTVYVGAIDGNQSAIYALSSADGSPRWRTPISATLSFQSAIHSDGQRLLIKTAQGNLLALSADTGKTLWQYQPRNKIAGEIGLHGAQVWLIHQDSRVSVLDVADGKLLATFNDALSSLADRPGAWRPTFIGNSALLPVGDRLVGMEVPSR